jgi:hypothetical protein
MALECLDTLVGLSQVDYDCFTDGPAPSGYNESDSGYFLTDADHGLAIIDRCEGEGWTLLQRSLSNGIRDFKTDLRASLLDRFATGLSPYSGLLGKRKNSGLLVPSKAFVGHRYTPHRLRGAKWVIKKFWVGMVTGGNYTIRVRSTDDSFTPISITQALTANTWTEVEPTTPIELPFYSIYDDEIEYFITVERNGSSVLNNSMACPTCGLAPAYPKYMDVTGMQADDADGTNGSFTSSGYGLSVEGYLACGDLDWLCELSELGGYSVLDVAARTIQFRGAAFAIDELRTNNEVNLCTIYNEEQLVARQNHLMNRYAANIQWLVDNVPSGITSCFTCKPENSFKRRNLKV